MRKPKTITLFLITFSLLSSAGSVFALEVIYPQVPGLPPITDDSGLSEYIGYFFGLAVYIAGILAVISFAIGAIQTIMAASSPEMATQGKDRMKGAVLGLVLTLSAFIILKTINPQFITPTLTPLPGVAGIYLAKDESGDDLKPTARVESNILASESIKKGYDKIYYKCTEGGEEIAPALLIWKFPKPNFQGNDLNYSGVVVKRKTCNQFEPVFSESSEDGNGSFKIAYETPGIYYFLEEDCAGFMSEANTATQNRIPEPFITKIKSVLIINDPGNSKYYGAIFHNKPNTEDSSDCTKPIRDEDEKFSDEEWEVEASTGNLEQVCLNLKDYSFAGFSAYSVEIFNQGRDPSSSSGDGVWFYGNVNGWDSGNKSGVAYVNAEKIGLYFWKEADDADTFSFNYAGVNTKLGNICRTQPSCSEDSEDRDCCFCATPKDWSSAGASSANEESGCGGSIRFGGNNYLVTLYTVYKKNMVEVPCTPPLIPDHSGKCYGGGTDALYCQSFKTNTPNLSTRGSFLPPGENELTNINIIPIH